MPWVFSSGNDFFYVILAKGLPRDALLPNNKSNICQYSLVVPFSLKQNWVPEVLGKQIQIINFFQERKMARNADLSKKLAKFNERSISETRRVKKVMNNNKKRVI